MSLSTLYAFFVHDVLGNLVAAILLAVLGYTANKVWTCIRKRNDQTRITSQ
ncbi:MULTISPECIES: hypothetical protein [unclassified Streptomyces]|uniref:hypothetical protein n=1 Tax=unclassified Streptomyces TaxID=2593676 RepID=UPI000AFAB018|nr:MULTISPECIES: hypothetical protein [unclassified Streptomyces]